MKYFGTVVLTVLMALAACDNHDDDPNSVRAGGFTLKKNIGLDMATVAGFTLVPAASAGQAPRTFEAQDGGSGCSSGPDGCLDLYALTSTGAVVAVSLIEDTLHGPNGPDWVPLPSSIYDTKNFVLFVYSHGSLNISGLNRSCGMVALQKSTGDLFCSDDSVQNCPMSEWCNAIATEKMVQHGDDPNVLFTIANIPNSSAFTKLDFSDPVSAVATRLLEGNSEAITTNFVVNAAGDALVTLMPNGTNFHDLRIYRAQGGFKNLKQFSGQLCTFAGPGTDAASFYVVTPPANMMTLPDPAFSNQIWRVSLTASGDVTMTSYAPAAAAGLSLQPCWQVSQAATRDRHFIAFFSSGQGPTEAAKNQFAEVVNAAASPKNHTIVTMSAITRLYACENELFLKGRDVSGNDQIVRYYPDAETYETVVASDEYTVANVAVSKQCELTFSGRRAADNARIIGNVPAGSGEVTIVTKELSGDVKQIVRIN